MRTFALSFVDIDLSRVLPAVKITLDTSPPGLDFDYHHLLSQLSVVTALIAMMLVLVDGWLLGMMDLWSSASMRSPPSPLSCQ